MNQLKHLLSRARLPLAVLVVSLAILQLTAASRSLSAQVVCNGDRGCDPYGAGFAPSIQSGVLEEAAEQAAEAATLNAIFGMPLAIEAPETFGAGVHLSAAGGSIDRDFAGGLLSEDGNVNISGWPVAAPARGGALGSSFYLNLPGSIVGLRRDYVLGVHGGFHSFKQKGELSLGLPSAGGDESAGGGGTDITSLIPQPEQSFAVRTRNLGVRLGAPLVDPVGWAYLRWNGVQGSIGLSYAHNRSDVESKLETQGFLQGNALDSVLAAATPDTQLAALAGLVQNLEYRTVQTTDSRNIVIPLEVRTGVRVTLLSLGVGLGGALNYGRHIVETRYGGEVCGGLLGAGCTEVRNNEGLLGVLTADAAALSAVFAQAQGGSRPAFIGYDRRRINSRAFVPYATARVSLHLYLFDIVISGMQSRESAAASLALETNW